MHSFPFWIRVACVPAERSRSAPQALGYSCSRWLPLPVRYPSLEPPRKCAQPPKPAHLPVTVSIHSDNHFPPPRM
eukprot:6180138-Pleurochrysis_carterae.AAC.1